MILLIIRLLAARLPDKFARRATAFATSARPVLEPPKNLLKSLTKEGGNQ